MSLWSVRLTSAIVLMTVSLGALACACCGPDRSAYSLSKGADNNVLETVQDLRLAIQGNMGDLGEAGSGGFMENPTMTAKWNAPAQSAGITSHRTMSIRLSQKDRQGQWQGLNLLFTPKPAEDWTTIFRTEPNTNKRINRTFGYATRYIGHHEFVVPGTLSIVSDPNKYWSKYSKLEAQFVFKGNGSHCFGNDFGENGLARYHAQFRMLEKAGNGWAFLNGEGTLK